MDFPNQGLSKNVVDDRLQLTYDEIPGWKGENNIYRFGFAMTKPHEIAVQTLQKFLKKNNNNVGVHTVEDKNHLIGTRGLEAEAVTQIASLLNGKNIDGYISSGGTEGNITGCWIGRNTVKNMGSRKVCLLISELTHHSLIKAAKLLDIPCFLLPVGADYGLDESILKQKLSDLIEDQYDGFIFCFTAGYYSTGSSDNIPYLCDAIKQYLTIKNVPYYIHIDACFGGFVYPFTDPKFVFDFRNKSVSSISVDPHKMGLMPYSCGIFLCHKNLLKNIAIVNEHAKLVDRTLIGSRSGATAAALWANINTLGFSGYKDILNQCLKQKKYFLAKLRQYDPQAITISYPNINNFAIHFTKFHAGILPKDIEEQYRIVSNSLPVITNERIVSLQFYHFYTMPYINRKAINTFMTQLRKATDVQ